MITALHADGAVNKSAFSQSVTEADFIVFVPSNILILLMQNKTDCKPLCKIIRRTVY